MSRRSTRATLLVALLAFLVGVGVSYVWLYTEGQQAGFADGYLHGSERGYSYGYQNGYSKGFLYGECIGRGLVSVTCVP